MLERVGGGLEMPGWLGQAREMVQQLGGGRAMV
jgi:hypothetical protein